jgi:hypothetical protein
VWESVANNVPRLHYPVGGGCPSWLNEPQKTNLHPQSRLRTGWTATGNFTATDETLLGLEGRKLVCVTTGNGIDFNLGLRALSLSYSFVSGTTYSISFYVKKTGTNSKFGWYTSGTNQVSAVFDVVLGTRATGYNENVTRVGFSIENLGGDIYRLTDVLTYTANITNTTFTMGFGSGVNGQVAGDEAIFSQLQIEAGASATSPIITAGSALTRLGDLPTLSKTITQLSTFVSECFLQAGSLSDGLNYRYFDVRTASNNRITCYRQNNTIRVDVVTPSGVSFSNVVFTLPTLAVGQRYIFAIRLNSGSFNFFANGALVFTSTTILMPTFTTATINYGSDGASTQWSGSLGVFLNYDLALTDPQCIALTTL